MSELINTVKDGFNLESNEDKELDIAFNSLGIAIKAYFSTYQSFKNDLNIFSNPNVEKVDLYHQSQYCELCTETIIHFQHFFELACKKILKDEHPLLSDVALTKPMVLHKLLNGQKLTDQESSTLRSIEFSEAISRLEGLIKSELLPNHSKLQFIKEQKNILVQVNALRNRIWHRGVFVLRYPSLDKFVCKFLLPLVRCFIKLDQFKDNERLWRYNPLSCGIDPIDELINAYQLDSVDIKKIAFLKELGRAAYSNPLLKASTIKKSPFRSFESIFNNKHIQRAIRISEAEAKNEFASIENCPVCNVKSLVLYSESDCEYGEEGEIINGYTYTDRVICECCSLSLTSGFENASKYGIPNINDFWKYTKF